jgi:hygromycin-B 7''-O-kinase
MLPTDPADPMARALKADPARWQPVALRVARDAGVAPDRFEPYPDGSALVAQVAEEAVVKLVPDAYRDEVAAERWALDALTGRELPVVVSERLGEIAEEGWTGLVLRHVPGRTMSSVWEALDERDRVGLLEEIGVLIAAVRALGDPGPAPHAPAWPAFLDAQRAGAEARHTAAGVPTALTAGLGAFLDRALPGLRDSSRPPALLTGEYTPFNLHVAERGGRWRLVGMLDFGDAFRGDPRYDVIGPGVFLGAGDPARVTALLRGAGLGDAAALRAPLLALHLLHRFSDLDAQIARPGWREAPDLDALARWLWPDPS